MKRKIFLYTIIVITIFTGLFYFFTKNNYKTLEFGNTSIKSAQSIKEYILNLESYEAQMEVKIYSNKNENQYIIKQTYQAPNIAYQEIIEPQSVKGVIITYDGNNLKIENTALNLSKIYENYPYITENYLWLSDFINDYKNNVNSSLEEEEKQIIMTTTKTNELNENNVIKTLYINKDNLKPEKLEIKDKNQKMLVYILYKEIKISSSR